MKDILHQYTLVWPNCTVFYYTSIVKFYCTLLHSIKWLHFSKERNIHAEGSKSETNFSTGSPPPPQKKNYLSKTEKAKCLWRRLIFQGKWMVVFLYLYNNNEYCSRLECNNYHYSYAYIFAAFYFFLNHGKGNHGYLST